ncbi:PAS domain-containing sensor histidine kinase [Actinophytocola sp.]|uniref:PAS domain-containing sensor histidine kinase n=1 Tax=Actinophytocola sp. TaxID=1872138 RepID=UPI002ED29C49
MTDIPPSALSEHTGESEILNLATYMEPMVRGLQTGILMVNVDRIVLMANDALISQLEVRATPKQLVGMNAGDMLKLRVRPEEDYREVDEFIRVCVESGEPLHGVELALGTDQTVEVDFVPIVEDGRLLGRLWGIRNATERTAARRTLERRNEELSRLATLKTEFLATLSHELRTPLTALTGLTELLTAGMAGEDDVIAEAVRRNVERMNALVETLLLLARVESGDFPLEIGDFDLTELLRRKVTGATSTADFLSVQLRLVTDATSRVVMTGDEKLIGQMLHHAIVSVISSSGNGSVVDVRVETDDEEGRWAVEIANHRPHASTDSLLFTRAPQAEPGTQAIGSGLGITLARAIAERHGGSLDIKPPEDGDHIVRVELPMRDLSGNRTR